MTQSKPMDANALRKALCTLGAKKLPSDATGAFKVVVWELMKCQTAIKQMKDKMDKLINKVKADVSKGAKGKAKKDIAKLLKADKKQDSMIEHCKKAMKKPVKRGRK